MQICLTQSLSEWLHWCSTRRHDSIHGYLSDIVSMPLVTFYSTTYTTLVLPPDNSISTSHTRTICSKSVHCIALQEDSTNTKNHSASGTQTCSDSKSGRETSRKRFNPGQLGADPSALTIGERSPPMREALSDPSSERVLTYASVDFFVFILRWTIFIIYIFSLAKERKASHFCLSFWVDVNHG